MKRPEALFVRGGALLVLYSLVCKAGCRPLQGQQKEFAMFPVVMILIGAAVLAFGKRLSVLGAAVGALVGVVLLRLLPGSSDPWLQLIIVGLLAVLGFVGAGFAKGIVNILLLVLGTLAGAAIVLGFLDLFTLDLGLLRWLLAVAGGVAGIILVRRFSALALTIFAGLVGGLLVTRGLAAWLPVLQGALGTLLVLALAAIGIAFQGGFLSRRNAGSGKG